MAEWPTPASAPQRPCRTASSPGSRRPRSNTNPHREDRASPPAENSSTHRRVRCPRAVQGPGCTTPADYSGSIAIAACSAFLASSIFCSVSSAMPSLIAACASFGSFLNASANALLRLFGKLLSHQRHAAIVQSHRISVEARLRSRHCRDCERKYCQEPARLHPPSAQITLHHGQPQNAPTSTMSHNHPVYASAAATRSNPASSLGSHHRTSDSSSYGTGTPPHRYDSSNDQIAILTNVSQFSETIDWRDFLDRPPLAAPSPDTVSSLVQPPDSRHRCWRLHRLRAGAPSRIRRCSHHPPRIL